MENIKNIIFDLGGVVVDLRIRPSLEAFARLGLTPKGISLEYLSQNGIPRDWEMRPLMHAMDCGELSAEEFVGIMKGKSREGTTDQDIIDAFNHIIHLPKRRLEWLRELRRHYRVYLLSNIGDLHWQETLRQAAEHGIPLRECFDEVFLSYRLHMVKPDPRIYEVLIGQTGIAPAETLYIDDLPDNIKAGQKRGLVSHKIDCNALDRELPRLFPFLAP